MKNFRKILLVGAHTDDGEWACGGSVHRWIREGCEVHYVAFSAAEQSLRPEFAQDATRTEFFVGAQRMGIPRERARIVDIPVRHFPEHRQAILETLIKLRQELQPDTVLVHCSFDTHQDHETLCKEVFRAFKKCTILGYEMLQNCRESGLNFFQEISQDDLQAKIEALKAYESQQWRSGDVGVYLTSLATVRGAQAGLPLAEAFEVIRWVAR